MRPVLTALLSVYLPAMPHTYTHAYIHTYTHTCMCAHSYTHTQKIINLNIISKDNCFTSVRQAVGRRLSLLAIESGTKLTDTYSYPELSHGFQSLTPKEPCTACTFTR